MKKYALLLLVLFGVGLGALLLSYVYLTPAPEVTEISGPEGYVRVELKDVKVTSAGGVMYLAEEDSEVLLPIFISNDQARVISMLMNNISFERPSMHDLLTKVLGKVGAKLSYISVDRLDEGIYYATVVIEDGERIGIDARPSDSIILALVNRAPIYVRKDLIEEEGVARHPPAELLEGIQI